MRVVEDFGSVFRLPCGEDWEVEIQIVLVEEWRRRSALGRRFEQCYAFWLAHVDAAGFEIAQASYKGAYGMMRWLQPLCVVVLNTSSFKRRTIVQTGTVVTFQKSYD